MGLPRGPHSAVRKGTSWHVITYHFLFGTDDHLLFSSLKITGLDESQNLLRKANPQEPNEARNPYQSANTSALFECKQKEMAGLGNWGNPTFFQIRIHTPVILGTKAPKVPDFTTSGHQFDCASMQEREAASQPNPSGLRCCSAAVS